MLYRNLVSLCSKGGFSLTKWLSNRTGVLKVIPENNRAKCMEGLDMELDSLPVERVLGVEWSIKSDSFKFRIALKDRTDHLPEEESSRLSAPSMIPLEC